ncbi:MAG: uncharacterized protein JWP02_483 [Acidimicrobiales bacterium]|nr:uncharacterized protein [Acidimicrobiales bacterium]
MRRTAAAVGFTVVGLWLVLSFKSSPLHSTSSLSAAAPSTTVAAPPDDNGGQPAAAAPPPTQPTTNTTARPSGTQTLTGDVVSNRYGEVQVAVVVQGTRILDVKALRLPFDRSRSQEISNQAAPLLRREVLSAQSAQIDTISGATYTSDSYAQSLQSALDRARA